MDKKEEETKKPESPDDTTENTEFQFKSIDRVYSAAQTPSNRLLSIFKFVFWAILILAVLYGVLK